MKTNVRNLVDRAIECCPLDMDSWLDFAISENYEDVKMAIDEVRRRLPKEPAIWITAAKLEEANGRDNDRVERIVERSIWVMKRDGGVIERDSWIGMAESAERGGYVTTSRAMFANLYRVRVEEEDEEESVCSSE